MASVKDLIRDAVNVSGWSKASTHLHILDGSSDRSTAVNQQSDKGSWP
jgi:hypothetical protein